MMVNLERALDHLDIIEEQAEILLTETVRITYEMKTGVDVESD